MALITGWSRGSWSSGSWSRALPVEITGVSSATAAGSVSVFNDTNVSVTGVSSATAAGSVSVSGKANVSATGVQSETFVGNPRLWKEIVPGQDARWDPITYTQAPNWSKIAA